MIAGLFSPTLDAMEEIFHDSSLIFLSTFALGMNFDLQFFWKGSLFDCVTKYDLQRCRDQIGLTFQQLWRNTLKKVINLEGVLQWILFSILSTGTFSNEKEPMFPLRNDS